MEPINILDHIMKLGDKMDKIKIVAGGAEYEIDAKSTLLEFGVNVVLVLHGARLAYKVDGDVAYDIIVNEVLKNEPDLMIINMNREFIICRQDGQHDIQRIIKNRYLDKDAYHTAMGIILGYDYIANNDELSHEPNYYIISYTAKKMDGAKASIYSFKVPINKYNDTIKRNILLRLEKYNKVLQQYNISVTMQLFKLYNGSFNKVDFDNEVIVDFTMR